MKTYLDIGNNFIYIVKTPTNNYQEANKSYVDKEINYSTTNLATKTELGDYFKKDGSVLMTGNLEMNNNRIYDLPLPTEQINQQHWFLQTTNIFLVMEQLQCLMTRIWITKE